MQRRIHQATRTERRRTPSTWVKILEPDQQRRVADFLESESARIAALDRSSTELESVLAEPALSQFVELTGGSCRPVSATTTTYNSEDARRGKTKRGRLVPYLRNQNVSWDRLDLTDVKEIPLTAAERREYALRTGDLVACEGRHVGKSAVWHGGVEPMYFQKALHRIRARDNWSTRYLMWCLWLGNSRGDYYADGTGSTIPHLPAEKMRAVRIPSVSPESQAVIVREVDAVHARSQSARNELAEFRLGLAEYRDALINDAIHGRLGLAEISETQVEGSAIASSTPSEPLSA